MVAFTVATYGGLNVAFNNAGVYNTCEVTKIEDDMVSRVLDTNVKSVVWLLKYEVHTACGAFWDMEKGGGWGGKEKGAYLCCFACRSC